MNKDPNSLYKLNGETIIKTSTVEEFEKTPGLGFTKNIVDRLLSTNLNIFGLKAEVSTVFLVRDHGDSDDELPVLFETMVFSEIKESSCKFQDQYSKLNEAIVGHSKMILIASAFLKNHAEELKNKGNSK